MRDPAVVQRRMGYAIRAAIEQGVIDADTGEWLRLCSLYATGEWSAEHDAVWMDDPAMVRLDLDRWLEPEEATV